MLYDGNYKIYLALEKYTKNLIKVHEVVRILKKELVEIKPNDPEFQNALYQIHDTIFYEKIFERIKNQEWFNRNIYKSYFHEVILILIKAYQSNDSFFRSLLELIHESKEIQKEKLENFNLLGRFYFVRNLSFVYKKLIKENTSDKEIITLLKKDIKKLNFDYEFLEKPIQDFCLKLKYSKTGFEKKESNKNFLLKLFETIRGSPSYCVMFEYFVNQIK